MRIGEFAAKAAVSVQTIRFYERKGILEGPPRSNSGYRCYGESDLETLWKTGPAIGNRCVAGTSGAWSVSLGWCWRTCWGMG